MKLHDAKLDKAFDLVTLALHKISSPAWLVAINRRSVIIDVDGEVFRISISRPK